MTAEPRAEAVPHRPAARNRTWRSLLLPALLAFAALIALGTWQVERKAWKEALIASLTERLAAPPQALPPAKDWAKLDRAGDEYRRVKFTASFDNAREALVFAAASAFRPDVTSPGYWVFTPARLADGSIVVVNRGFVPDARRDPKSRPQGQIAEAIEIPGALRWPDERHWFTPADDVSHNLWFTRDPAAIAAAKGLDKGLDPRTGAVAPFYVEQEAPTPPGGLPQPGKLVVALPDNHLQYALTWYGLAAVLAAVFGFWAASSGRRTVPADRP
ncbi:MAG TPA: SURF1 family protein [Xanthobacteraceae bacterium]|nr:SURF1 family protein [Xanthobacteraceae bacterium]